MLHMTAFGESGGIRQESFLLQNRLRNFAADPVFASGLCLVKKFIHVMHDLFEVIFRVAGNDTAADGNAQSRNLFKTQLCNLLPHGIDPGSGFLKACLPELILRAYAER